MNKEKKSINEEISLLRRQVYKAVRLLEIKIQELEKELQELKNEKIFQTK